MYSPCLSHHSSRTSVCHYLVPQHLDKTATSVTTVRLTTSACFFNVNNIWHLIYILTQWELPPKLRITQKPHPKLVSPAVIGCCFSAWLSHFNSSFPPYIPSWAQTNIHYMNNCFSFKYFKALCDFWIIPLVNNGSYHTDNSYQKMRKSPHAGWGWCQTCQIRFSQGDPNRSRKEPLRGPLTLRHSKRKINKEIKTLKEDLFKSTSNRLMITLKFFKSGICKI